MVKLLLALAKEEGKDKVAMYAITCPTDVVDAVVTPEEQLRLNQQSLINLVVEMEGQEIVTLGSIVVLEIEMVDLGEEEDA